MHPVGGARGIALRRVAAMSKKQQQQPGLSWKDEPDEHDFPAAADYLSLLLSDPGPAVDELRRSQTVQRKAKDLLRASRLPLLSPGENRGGRAVEVERKRGEGERRGAR